MVTDITCIDGQRHENVDGRCPKCDMPVIPRTTHSMLRAKVERCMGKTYNKDGNQIR